MDKLFSTDQEKAEAIANLEAGAHTPFWQTICKILDYNIEYAKLQLEQGTGENETAESIKRVRERLKVFRDIRSTPETMVAKLKQPDFEEYNPDPYDQLPEEDLTTPNK